MTNFAPFNRSDDLVLTATLNDVVTHTPDLAGHISIKDSGVIVETAIVNSSTPAVVSLLSGSTVLGTISLADGTAKGKFIHFTPTASYLDKPDVYFAANTELTIKTTTAGLGGTPAGKVAGVFSISHGVSG